MCVYGMFKKKRFSSNIFCIKGVVSFACQLGVYPVITCKWA
jgi:hypothetical protein